VDGGAAGVGPPINLGPGQSGSRGPGAYAAVQVFQNATLTLSTGTYYFDSLQLESGSHVVLNQTSGPVIIYVRTTLALRGDIRASASGAAPDLLLVYLGSTDASAEVAFSGTIVAPNARLFLGSVTPGHTGASTRSAGLAGPNRRTRRGRAASSDTGRAIA